MQEFGVIIPYILILHLFCLLIVPPYHHQFSFTICTPNWLITGASTISLFAFAISTHSSIAVAARRKRGEVGWYIHWLIVMATRIIITKRVVEGIAISVERLTINWS